MNKTAWSPFEDAAAPEWDAFVEAHPHGRFLHLTGFKRTVETVYGLRANYWLHRDGGRLRAVFPSFFHSAWVTGRKLVSQPFSEYGGILLAPEAGPDERRAILAGLPQVVERSREQGRFAYLELRGFPDLRPDERGLFREIRMGERAVLPLDPALKLMDKVDYSVRKNVRRARTGGLELRPLESTEEIRRVFYPLHLRSLRRLGSPPHPLDYFIHNWENMAGRMRVLTARVAGRPVAALLGWAVGRSVQITDIASDERFFALRAPDLLHFEMIDWAIGRGFRLFDFGPVRYEGQRRYKKKWGVEVLPYAHYCLPDRTGRGPLSDQTRTARAARSVWRLVPSGLAARLGRRLRRELAI